MVVVTAINALIKKKAHRQLDVRQPGWISVVRGKKQHSAFTRYNQKMVARLPTCCGRLQSLTNLNQDLSRCNPVTFRNVNGFHSTRYAGINFSFHFHRFGNQDSLTRLNDVTLGH